MLEISSSRRRLTWSKAGWERVVGRRSDIMALAETEDR